MAESTKRPIISRTGSLISARMNRSAADLYSCRWPSCGTICSLSNASRRYSPCAEKPKSPTAPLGCSQICSNAQAR